ncbi:hypothetical protein PDN47_25875 [Bacillus cereus]|nr:hypothetical protein [Bacillus cereus]
MHWFYWFVIGIIMFGIINHFIGKLSGNKGSSTNLMGIVSVIGILVVGGFVVYEFITVDDSSDNRYEMGDYPEDPTKGNDNPGVHSVNGYYRSDGTYVEGHMRSNPDGIKSNNLNPNK